MPMWPNLTLVWNRSRSTQGHNLNTLGSTYIDNATYQVSRSSVYWFSRRRFFKVFIIYGHGGHVGRVTQLICINFHSHSPISFHMSFGSKSLNYFCEKTRFNFEIWVTFVQGQRMNLTFDTHLTSLTHLVECFKQLWDLKLQKFPKKWLSRFPKYDLSVKWVKVNQGS